MPSYKAKAIILKSYKLGESDKIVKMYSSDGDIISAVAKGARKVRSRFGGRLELFNVVDLELNTGRNLDIINQVEIIKSFKNIASDFYKFVFCEIISKIILKTQVSGGDLSPLLFKLIYICFNEINNQDLEDIVALKKTMCFFGIKFLYDLFNLKLEDLRDMEVNLPTIKRVYQLIENYIVYHTECNVDSFKYLKKIGM